MLPRPSGEPKQVMQLALLRKKRPSLLRNKRPSFGGRPCVGTEQTSVASFLRSGCGLPRRLPVYRLRVAAPPLGLAAAFGFDGSIPTFFSGHNDFRNWEWNNHGRASLIPTFLSRCQDSSSRQNGKAQ